MRLPCLWSIPEIGLPAICRSIRNGKTAFFIKRMKSCFRIVSCLWPDFPAVQGMRYSRILLHTVIKKSSPVNTGCFLRFHMKL